MLTFAVPISRDTYWRDARVAEEARLESVCTPKGYREFESRSLRSQQQPSANSAGLFWYAADASSLVDDVYRNGPNDRQVVGCCMVARPPREGTEIATASGRRNLASP